MKRRDRLALMSAIIHASRTIAIACRAGGGTAWENSPADAADNLDADVEHYIDQDDKKKRGEL